MCLVLGVLVSLMTTSSGNPVDKPFLSLGGETVGHLPLIYPSVQIDASTPFGRLISDSLDGTLISNLIACLLGPLTGQAASPPVIHKVLQPVMQPVLHPRRRQTFRGRGNTGHRRPMAPLFRKRYAVSDRMSGGSHGYARANQDPTQLQDLEILSDFSQYLY